MALSPHQTHGSSALKHCHAESAAGKRQQTDYGATKFMGKPVGGSPFMAADPSGMKMFCIVVYGTEGSHSGVYKGDDGIFSEDYIVQSSISSIVCFGGSLFGGGRGDEYGSYDFGEPGGGPGEEEAKQKTDCERYAEALANHAAGYRDNYRFTASTRFGIDLYNRARKARELSSFGLSPNWSGFKDKLVNHGQKSGVYRHVSAALGSTLALGFPLGPLFPIGQTLVFDLGIDYMFGNPQGLPEAHGNIAGMLLAPAFNQFFEDRQSKEFLKRDIIKMLCE